MAKNINKYNYNKDTSEIRLTHKLKIAVDWVDTWRVVVVAGRGMAKTQEIQAERTLRIVQDMPGAPLAFICDTYVNFSTNILPALKVGWKRKKWYEDIHYVSNKRPPEEWLKRCSIIVDDFKHTIFFRNGTVIFAGSLDRPSLLAGKSVVHIFSDEAKYQADVKVDRAFPILRGDATLYGYSTYFLGMTVTTDMPNPTEGEYDWVFRFAKEMDVSRIKQIISAYGVLNDLYLKLYREYHGAGRLKQMENLEKQINKWLELLRKARYEQTFFINSSSLNNIQFLTTKYINGLIQTLETEDFNKSVLGLRPSLKKTLRFYPNIAEHHFFNDGFNYKFIDRYSLKDDIPDDSRILAYVKRGEPLEAGFDTGNMKSLVIGQLDGPEYRLLKFLYTIPPESFRSLGDKFIRYFQYHENKTLDLWYDRAANQFQSMGEDAAGALKDAIEKDSEGNRTGWMVNLKSRKQPNIKQETEYEFMIAMLKEETPGLPKLRIDAVNCKEVKASMENAPAKISYRRKEKVVSKDKRSERYAVERLPMESTNPSDAVKYLLLRREWEMLLKPKRRGTFIPVSTE